MKKGWKRISLCLAAMVFALLMSAVGVHAAASVKTNQWADMPAVKAGGAWFRSMMILDEETFVLTGMKIEMSKTSSKKNFKTLIEGAELSGSFATDGKTLYFLQSNVLMSLDIKTAATKVIKKLKAPNGRYYEFHGFFNNKIWLLGRTRKYGAPVLYSYNPKTKKFKTEKKNFLCFNAASPSRYLVISEGRTELKTKKNATYTLKLFDKKKGKTTLLVKKAIPWGYASGGSYDTMAKWFVYGAYNKSKKAWQIKEYKFKNKKTYVLKTLKKGQIPGILYLGTGVRYSLSTDPQGGEVTVTADRILKAK